MLVALLIVFTALLAVVTLVPFLPIAHGSVRICDFPRLQIVGLAVALIVLTAGFGPEGAIGAGLLAVQIAVVAVQGAICLRFTPLWRVQSLRFAGADDDPAVVRIVTSNVKMSNRSHEALVSLVRERDPHVAIFMEVDDDWLKALAPLKERLPFTIEQPQDNTYGMVLFSRLPLVDPELRFLLIDEVPSIRTAVELPDGRPFRLHVLHPEPPLPLDDTLGRDGELVLTAKDVKSDTMPAIVTGDLNDVAWSRTTRRFQRLSGLLDPRVGRGFFNSFDARYPVLRWPLDHLFHDPRFRLLSLERLPHVGSDHFPMQFELALAEDEAADEKLDKPGSTDIKEAREVVGEAARLDRPAIGTDLED